MDTSSEDKVVDINMTDMDQEIVDKDVDDVVSRPYTGALWRTVTILSVAYNHISFLGFAIFYSLVAFASDTIIEDETAVHPFLLFLYIMSWLFLTAMLVLALLGKLTTTDHYKHREGNSFIRGGVIVLGSGAVLYSCLNIIEEYDFSGVCSTSFDRGLSLIRLFNLLTELTFIYIFTKIRINFNRTIAIVCRFMIMHFILTNMVTWLRVTVEEMQEEILEVKEITNTHGENSEHSESSSESSSNSSTNHTTLCYLNEGLSSSLSPYLFPLTVEYSLLVSVLWLSIWENCGVICQMSTQSNNVDGSNGSPSKTAWTKKVAKVAKHTNGRAIVPSTELTQSDTKVVPCQVIHTELKTGFRNSGIGFMLGLMVLLYSILMVIVFLFWQFTDTYMDRNYMNMAYGCNVSVSCFLLVGIPFTAYQLKRIEPIKVHHNKESEMSEDEFNSSIGEILDMRLLGISSAATLIYKFLSVIAACAEGLSSYSQVFIDGIITMLTVIGQTIFIKHFLPERVCITQHQLETKPGRQGLELLRFTNVSHWIINTFILKQTITKIPQLHLYGPEAWTFISNFVQPLTILYYFHSMILYAERIKETYDVKHVKKVLGINTHIKVHVPITNANGGDTHALLVPPTPKPGQKRTVTEDIESIFGEDRSRASSPL